MIERHEEASSERQPLTRLEFGVVCAIVYVVAALLLFWPGMFFGLGLQEVGADLGWWGGDPNSDDGVGGLSLNLGFVAVVAILFAAALVVRAVGRRWGRRWPLAVFSCTAALVLGSTALGVWAFTAT